MCHDFSQFPGLCPQDFRDPKEDRGFIYGVAIADISLSRQEGGGYRGKGGRSEGLRAEWNDRVLYKYRCSVGASSLGKSPGTNDAFNNLATSFLHSCPLYFPLFFFFVIFLPFTPFSLLSLYRANVLSSICAYLMA